MSSANNGCACCKARFVKFRLAQRISREDNRQVAQVEEFWDGDDPTPSEGSFYVYNLCCEGPAGGCTKWAYDGEGGSVGYAVLDDQNESDGSEEECFYRIIQLLPCCEHEHTGDTGTIRFMIISANVEAGIAIANVLARPCCVSEVPGESELQQVVLIDALGCLLEDEEDDDLVGRTGYAKYMSSASGCQWEILSLCCP